MKNEWNSKNELSFGDKAILSRNQNEIKELREAMRRSCRHYLQCINELSNQNREILGRD